MTAIFTLALIAAAPDKLVSKQWLLGTWKCEDTVGDFHGTYDTSWSTTLDDRWLRQTWDFPARGGKPALKAEALMSYDARRDFWVRFFAMSDGFWAAMRMTETKDGFTWKYVSLAKNRKPETDVPDATLIRRSDQEYVIEGPTYPEGGKMVTEHHVCRKK